MKRNSVSTRDSNNESNESKLTNTTISIIPDVAEAEAMISPNCNKLLKEWDYSRS